MGLATAISITGLDSLSGLDSLFRLGETAIVDDIGKNRFELDGLVVVLSNVDGHNAACAKKHYADDMEKARKLAGI